MSMDGGVYRLPSGKPLAHLTVYSVKKSSLITGIIHRIIVYHVYDMADIFTLVEVQTMRTNKSMSFKMNAARLKVST